MILADRQIDSFCRDSGMVTPYRPENLQPASLDVTLWDEFRVFEPHAEGVIDLANPPDITKRVKADKFVLHPGEFILGSTEEAVKMPAGIVGRIEGKSSLGRLGLIVHATAGYIDPGYEGTITLEMGNMLRLPIVLRPGKLVAQLSFHKLVSPPWNTYQGRYQGMREPAASRYTGTQEHPDEA
jgi:dCTP deaminase